MKFLSAIIAGLVAAIIIRFFSIWLNKITKKDVDLTWYMGRFVAGIFKIPGPVEKWKVLGYLVYFLTAIGIALCYQILWSIHVGSPNVFYGILFGFLTGMAGLATWRLILMKASNPPYVPVKFYALNYLLEYLVFGLLVVLIWQGVFLLLSS